MLVSIVIRTLNEEKYLGRLIEGIQRQQSARFEVEVVIVDSESIDSTVEIAETMGARVTTIKRSDFTFGRALNVGCEFARGDFLLFVSGHCIPVGDHWIHNLISPLADQKCDYSYGRQLGHESTKFSECRLFEKHFPDYSKLPQQGFFSNNANSAITREAWARFRFDEDLTGLEDMAMGKAVVRNGGSIGYIADAAVYHIHDESWRQVRRRYEREAYALKSIMPEIQFTIVDMVRFFFAGVYEDSIAAFREKRFHREFVEIVLFRMMHYWGTFRGHHEHRKLSSELKNRYFYPKDLDKRYQESNRASLTADESH